jgi:hypothetical protein
VRRSAASPAALAAASPASSTCTWPKHPSLLANLYESNGNTLLLTAHAHASAPGALPTRRPRCPTRVRYRAVGRGGRWAAGVALLLVTRRQSGRAAA